MKYSISKRNHLALIAAAALCLSACASTSAPSDSAKTAINAVPKHLALDLENENPDKAKIYVTRKYIVPTGTKAKISVGDTKLGSLKNGQYLEAYIEPGDHVLEIGFGKIWMVRGLSQNISVEGGETYAYEIENSLGVGGSVLARTSNLRLTYFDPEKEPFKISDLDKVETKN